MRAQQDDISIFGDPVEIFGPGKALETTLAELGKAGLEPNKKKPQVFWTTVDACADKPEWLYETFVVRDPARGPVSRPLRQKQQPPPRLRPLHHQ